MTVQIIDYSWGRPPPQDIVNAGYIGVMRYIGAGNNGRDLTPGELESLLSHGLGVGLIWETTAGRALSGFDGGCYDASQAAYYATALGVPDAVPIYFACDTNVSTADAWGVVSDYFRGCMHQPHPARAYGEADVLDACAAELGYRHGWYAGARAWSDYRETANASMIQQVGYVLNDTSDYNDVVCPSDQIDWLWYGGDMGLSQSDLNAIQNIVTSAINATLTGQYTGARSLQAQGDGGVYELVISGGQLMRRHVPNPTQLAMLQWVDHLAGPPEQGPRMITNPDYITEFNKIPVVSSTGREADDAGNFYEGGGFDVVEQDDDH